MIKFNKAELSKKFTKCKSAIKAGLIPVYSYVRIIASGGNYKMISLNGTYQASCTGEYEGDGAIDLCFDAAKFGLMIAAAKSDIEITVNDNVAKVKSGKSKFNFNVMPGDDMPIIEQSQADLVSFDLSELIGNVYLCAPVNNVNQILNGVHLQSSKGTVSAAATDGHVMAYSEMPIVNIASFELILPQEVAAIVSQNTCTDFAVDGKRNITIHFEDGFVMVSKVIDGQYPNWRSISNLKSDGQFTVNKKELKDVIDTALKTGERAVTIDVKDNAMTIVSKSNGFVFESEMLVESDSDVSTSFNPLILSLLCKSIKSDDLAIDYESNETGSNKFVCKDDEMTIIMMPLRM
jgi:DNA polymerase-3 subunit beta